MRHIVNLSGEYDLSCKDELHTQFYALRAEPNLVLDLSAVTYLDSSFLSQLVWLHEGRKERGFRTETLVIPKDSVVERLFEIVGMTRLFRVVRSVSDDDDANGDSQESDLTCLS